MLDKNRENRKLWKSEDFSAVQILRETFKFANLRIVLF